MRIAVLSTLIHPLAEPYAGGTEAITARLAAHLAAHGHRVTVFAAEGSAVEGAEIVSLGLQAGALQWPAPPAQLDGALMRDLAVREQEAFHRVFLYLRKHADDFDVLHNQSFSGLPIVLGPMQPIPMVTTLHVPPILLEQIAALRTLAAAQQPARLVAVSHGLAAEYSAVAPIDTVIHNGVDVPVLSDEEPDTYLLFVGRVSPEKGVDMAIAAARAAGRRLLIVGRIEDRAFFTRSVEPRLDGQMISYLGHLAQPAVWALMSRAAALLFTPRWPEPCSLAVLEALARGTPAIAFRLGGLAEQIVNGVTGFLVESGDIDAIAEAVDRLGAISRSACRQHIVRTFSLDAMGQAYDAYYRSLLETA